MKKLFEKIRTWFWFTFKNPVVRKGESGGFKWEFRSFWLEISTISGNFKARFMADQHPFAYLLSGEDDSNIIGYCQLVYTVSHMLTTEQRFADDIGKALSTYQKRLDKEAAGQVKDDETEEKIALDQEKQIQEHIELPKKQRRKVERDINGRFKKAVKEAEKK